MKNGTDPSIDEQVDPWNIFCWHVYMVFVRLSQDTYCIVIAHTRSCGPSANTLNKFRVKKEASYFEDPTRSIPFHSFHEHMDSQVAPARLDSAWPGSEHDRALQYEVQLGLWTDWSRGRVLGQTLTLDREQANLLIAFTASFVVFVGARFWRIICLFLHQVYSTSEPRDTLHHQRQVLLRNSGSSDSGVVG